MTKFCEEMNEKNKQLSKNFKSFQEKYKEFKNNQIKKAHELEEKIFQAENEQKTCKLFHHMNKNKYKKLNVKKNKKDNEKDSKSITKNEIDSMNKMIGNLREEKYSKEEENIDNNVNNKTRNDIENKNNIIKENSDYGIFIKAFFAIIIIIFIFLGIYVIFKERKKIRINSEKDYFKQPFNNNKNED